MRRILKEYELVAIRAAETRRDQTGIFRVRKQTPIHRGEKRAHLVSAVMDRLRDWRSSPFEFEGACIQGLRSALCLQGYAWQRSNAEAQAIVADALHRLGAKRPSWSEGQPGHVESSSNCAWCMKLMDDRLFGSQRHCSVECARAAALHRDQLDTRSSVYRAAHRLISRAEAPPKPCEYCGKPFRSEREEARFCSSRCVSRHQKGDSIRLDITCEVCGTVTKPRKQHSTVCSHACAGIIRRQRELAELENQTRVCKHCGDTFRPKSRSQVACGMSACERAAKRRKYHNNKTPAEYHLRCQWCGEVFVSKMPWARFCSHEHMRAAELALRPAKRPRPLSPLALDYICRRQGLRITAERMAA